MSKKYVLIKNTKEKLEVIEKNDLNVIIKNSKGQIYKVPSSYLISLEEYEAMKVLKLNHLVK